MLTESTLDGALVTTFTVTPGEDARRCSVTIATTQQAPGGFSGWLQGLTLPWIIRVASTARSWRNWIDTHKLSFYLRFYVLSVIR